MDCETWWFEASDAVVAAREVVHHDPYVPWERIPMPVNAAAASASLAALAGEFQKLPPSIRGALGRATGNAARLSDDRLQGLAELLQNADDEGADTAYFLVDDDRLLFGHNGSDFTLPDVWGLTVPWLSEKAGNADKLGRFGIGLKTLQNLSETLEGHNGHFHLRLGRSSLRATDPDPNWPNKPETVTTIFVVPFQYVAPTDAEVAEWLTSWGDAGLLFLRSLRSVTLLDVRGYPAAHVGISVGDSQAIGDAGGRALRTVVATGDGRTWLRYSRNAKSPVGHRAGKSHHDTTPVSVAFPRFDGDEGHVHVGLPVRSIGLPFRLAGQFDPLANRRDLADSQWNTDIVGLLADLWLDAVLDLFRLDPRGAWAAVPLDVEYAADAFTASPFGKAVVDHLMTAARLAFADRLELKGHSEDKHRLGDLAYETSDLTGILTDDDIRNLADTTDVLTAVNRSDDDRWRAVIADLEDLGAATPAMVDVRDALKLLRVAHRTIDFVADLTAAVVAVVTGDDEEGKELSNELFTSPCLVLADGRRTSPEASIGLKILVPPDASQLWSALGIGAHVHPTYAERPTWSAIAAWLHDSNALRRTATDEDALRIIAEAGRADVELPKPLSDNQANAVRAALELVDEATRARLAAGIGRAIRLKATVYDVDGKRTQVFARPADAYFIEKERNSWSNAAKKTPGIVWLHRRYSEVLRADTGRAGIGTQRFFRLLGAESVPRFEKFPDSAKFYKQFTYHGSGLWKDAPGSPSRRARQMNEVEAECTRDDHAVPDLEKVLADIAAEKNTQQRRERANALIGYLSRNWDRLKPCAKVVAASPYNGWINKGEVDAWWISQAASVPWLSNGRGKATAPDQLRIKTATNEAMYGKDPALYLAETHYVPAHRDVLSALGVLGNPTVAALIKRVEDIRAAHQSGRSASTVRPGSEPMRDQEAADCAAPFYQALAAEIHSGNRQRVGNMHARALRNHFDRGDGLIITNHGWRRTTLARSGDPIFGDLAAFVPAITGAEPLWTALGIHAPSPEDAKAVLKKLAATRALSTDEQQIMLEALRILARTSPEHLGQLRRQQVYVGNGWTSKRPVYAIENPLLAEGLKTSVAVWQPGGQLTQLKSLIEPLALTSIDDAHAKVLHESSASYDPDLTEVFRRAVRNLQTDLTQSAPASAEAINLTWEELVACQAAILPGLQVQVAMPGGGGHRVAVPAWLDIRRQTLFVDSPTEASRARSGGYAIASSFDTSPREIAHAWLAAWADAEAGAQAKLVVSAAARAAEEKLRREKSQTALNSLPTANQKAVRRTRRPKEGNTGRGIPGKPPASPRTRILVDPATLALQDTAGQLISGAGGTRSSGGTDAGGSGNSRLKDPKRDHSRTPSGGGRGPLNYTAEEREEVGMELLRLVLAGDNCTLTDVRHQPNVGADAVDDQDRFYELKVHHGPIPDTVKLEDSQIQRAMAAPDDFFLVIVGNVEDGQGNPEVRIIHDPLHHLLVQPQGAVHLTGVLSAQVARSWTFKSSTMEDETVS